MTFVIRPHTGRVIGFLDINGAGKTTALRVLLGRAAPSEGTPM